MTLETPACGQPLDPRAILTSIGEVVYTWDLSCDALIWGANASDLLGAHAERLISGRSFAGHLEPGSGRSPHEAITQSDRRDEGTGVPYRTRYVLTLEPGLSYSVEDTGRWFVDMEGRPGTAHGVLRLERIAPEGSQRTGIHDIGDRARLVSRLEDELVDARAGRRTVAVLVIAVTELGMLNEELGEEGGDEIMAEMSRRLAGTMRRRDVLVRYAGNRHAAILVSCPPEQLELAANRLIKAATNSPVETSRGAAGVRVRIGAALSPDHGVDAGQLLRRAEEALGEGKRLSTPGIMLYRSDPRREEERIARGAASHDVVAALNDRRLVLARQPIVEAGSRQVAFHEGLIRLRRLDGTIAGAGEIVPSVERLGLVQLVDMRVLELAVRHLCAQPTQRLAINISPLTLADAAWLPELAAHLGAHPGVAERMIIEIIETAAIEDPRAMRNRLDCMKALGVSIGIDDFGAGHTSFRHLRGFPIDLLKLDGAFVQNLGRSADDSFFVRTLIDLAQHLGIATVAEWVENEETARQLASWGVDYLQGDHLGRPMIDDADLSQTQGEQALPKAASA
jgi:diguanylate cyclase (GGDEF)-like protein